VWNKQYVSKHSFNKKHNYKYYYFLECDTVSSHMYFTQLSPPLSESS